MITSTLPGGVTRTISEIYTLPPLVAPDGQLASGSMDVFDVRWSKGGKEIAVRFDAERHPNRLRAAELHEETHALQEALKELRG